MASLFTEMFGRRQNEDEALGMRALQRLRAGREGSTRDPFETMFKMTPKRMDALLRSLNPLQRTKQPVQPSEIHRSPVITSPNEMQTLEGDFTKKAGIFQQTAQDIEQFNTAMETRQREFESGALPKPESGTFAFNIPGATASRDYRENLMAQFEHFARVLDLSGQVFQGAPGEFSQLKNMLQKAIQAQQSVAGTYSGMAAAGGEAAGLTAFQASAQAALAPHLSGAGEFTATQAQPIFRRSLGNIFKPTAPTTSAYKKHSRRYF